MKRWLKDNKGFLIFLLCFGVLRTAVADWNPVPSGSMRPTILEGDVVLVNRLAYDLKLPLTDISLASLGEPRRGDIVTFSSPKNGTRLIKRIVGTPGDVVEMREGRLLVNGVAARYSGQSLQPEPMFGQDLQAVHAVEQLDGSTHAVQYLPALDARRNFGPTRVPEGSYFMLGDNRDNSEDSRYIGTVPRRLLIGRAHHLLVSADITGDWMPRLGRTGQRLQ